VCGIPAHRLWRTSTRSSDEKFPYFTAELN
jgi:hypothetical protein